MLPTLCSIVDCPLFPVSLLPIRYVWESKADGSFAISEDTSGQPLGRGTQINIYLKEAAQEYLQEDKLKELVQVGGGSCCIAGDASPATCTERWLCVVFSRRRRFLVAAAASRTHDLPHHARRTAAHRRK